MFDILAEFNQAGLVHERVVTGGHAGPAGDLPKVNDSMPQSNNTSADIKPSEPKKGGDQNKDDDPTNGADQGNMDDKLMHSVVKSMEAAEAALDHICEECHSGKGKDYHEDKKRKMREYLEAAKGLRSGLHEMANMQDY